MKINILSRGQGRLSLIFPTPTSKSSKKTSRNFLTYAGGFHFKAFLLFSGQDHFSCKKNPPQIEFPRTPNISSCPSDDTLPLASSSVWGRKSKHSFPFVCFVECVVECSLLEVASQVSDKWCPLPDTGPRCAGGDGIFGVWKIEPLLAGKHRESINGRGSSFASVMGSN